MTGRALGTARIRAASGSAADSAVLRVATPAATVTLTPVAGIVLPDRTLTVTAVVRDSAGTVITAPALAWSSADTAIATVSSTGVVRGVRLGRTTVQARAATAVAAATVDVVAPVVTIQVRPYDLTLVVGGVLPLTATLLDAGNRVLTGRAVLWTVSDTLVAGVSADGVVTGRAPGLVTVAAAVEDAVGAVTLGVAEVTWAAVATSLDGHTCGVGTSGRVFCWGSDQSGQLGSGRQLSWLLSPIAVIGEPPPFVQVAPGLTHTCAITPAGGLYCWGSNFDGQFGDGTTTGSTDPEPVALPQPLRAIGAGFGHTCGLADSSAYCWGRGNGGQLGDSTYGSSTLPRAVVGGHRFGSLASGENHVCGITGSGAAWCWGVHRYGEVGDGSVPGPNTRFAPTAVAGGLLFRTISAGGHHTCGITTDSLAYCWGLNDQGQIGNTTTDRCESGAPCAVAPRRVAPPRRVVAVSAGRAHSCAIATDGLTYCWGDGRNGELGDGNQTSTMLPVAVAGGLALTAVSAGAGYTCGVTAAGTAYCWGANPDGRRGDGTRAGSPVPVRVPGGP